MPSGQSRIIVQAKFTNYLLGKTFETIENKNNWIKTIEDPGEKQIIVLEEHG